MEQSVSNEISANSETEKLPYQFFELSNENLLNISDKFNISQDEASQLVIAGDNLLGSPFSIGWFKRDLNHDKIPAYIDETQMSHIFTKPYGLDIGATLPPSGIGLYLKNRALLDYGYSIDDYGNSNIKRSFNGNRPRNDQWEYMYYHDGNLSKVIFDIDNYPQPETFNSLGIYNSHDVLTAIIPLRNEVGDKQIQDPELQSGSIENIYIRDIYTPESEIDVNELVQEVDCAIADVHERLFLSDGKKPSVEVILDSNKNGFETATYSHYYDSSGKLHHVLLLPKVRLDQCRDKRDRKRLFRHEYIHAILMSQGHDEESIAEIRHKEIFQIVNEALFDGKLVIDNILRGNYTFWPSNRLIDDSFNEANYLPSADGGHASQDLEELLVSALTCYTDEEFEEGGNFVEANKKDRVRKAYGKFVAFIQNT